MCNGLRACNLQLVVDIVQKSIYLILIFAPLDPPLNILPNFNVLLTIPKQAFDILGEERNV